VNKCLTLLSMMLGYAQEHEWIGKNPAAGVAKVKGPAQIDDESNVKALGQEEIQALLRKCAGSGGSSSARRSARACR